MQFNQQSQTNANLSLSQYRPLQVTPNLNPRSLLQLYSAYILAIDLLRMLQHLLNLALPFSPSKR